MDFLFGLVGKDFVLVAADGARARSVVVMQDDLDKSMKLSPHSLMLVSGDPGDTVQFGEYIQANLRLQALRDGMPATPFAQANFIRRQLALAIRSRSPKSVNLLLAGYDTGKEGDHLGPQLYFLDYLGTMAKANYTAHGYGGYFILSLLDRKWKPNMSMDEAKDVMKQCIAEVQKRLVVQLPKFTVHSVDAQGTHAVEL